MRRTAALLLFLAALAIDLPGPEESLITRALGRSEAPITAGFVLSLVPFSLLIISCAGRSRVHLALQAVGTVWFALLLGRAVFVTADTLLTAASLLATAGIAILSGVETIMAARRHTAAEPDRRLTIELLLVLAGVQLGYLAALMLGFPSSLLTPERILSWIVRPLGLASAFFVLAWGLRARRRWSSWIGAGLAGWLAAVTAWSFVRVMLQAQLTDTTRHSYVPLVLPLFCLEAILTLLLVRIAWRESWRREEGLTRMDLP